MVPILSAASGDLLPAHLRLPTHSVPLHMLQTFIDAPNAASGPIPDDVSPFFTGPYYEW